METSDNVLQQIQDVSIQNISGENRRQDLMVYIRKKLAYVAFEHKARSSMILACLVRKSLKAVYSAVCAFPQATRKRIRYERAVEEWIKLSIERVMEEPIAHARLVNIAGLRVGNPEMFVRAMPVRFVAQILMER